MLKMITFSIALAMAAAIGLPSRGGEPTCGGDPACGCPNCGDCPCGCCKCGCHEGMIPVCHTVWTTKKVTKYCYKCVCKEICLPGRCGACNSGFLGHCCPKDCGCQDSCGCKENCGCDKCGGCRFREVHSLVKCPYTEEQCVRECRIEWVCPRCGCHTCSDGTEAPAAPQAPQPTGKSAGYDAVPSIPPSPPAPQKSAANYPY